MPGTRKCPYCAEEISEEAVRCRYCRSRLTRLDPESWVRDHPERRIGGVAAAIAHGLALPLSLVHLGFLILTFIHLLGPAVYAALWLVIPFQPGEPSLLSSWLDRATGMFDLLRRDRDGRSSDRDAGGSSRRSPLRQDLYS